MRSGTWYLRVTEMGNSNQYYCLIIIIIIISMTFPKALENPSDLLSMIPLQKAQVIL